MPEMKAGDPGLRQKSSSRTRFIFRTGARVNNLEYLYSREDNLQMFDQAKLTMSPAMQYRTSPRNVDRGRSLKMRIVRGQCNLNSD